VRVLAVATCAIFGFVGASSANPLDSPGTIHIDGLPCNFACQSYMDWSRRTLNATKATARSAATASAGKTAGESSSKRVSKHVMPTSVDASGRKKIHNSETAVATTPIPLPLPKPQADNAPPNPENGKPSKQRSPQEQLMAALEVAEKMTNHDTLELIGNNGADEIKPSDGGNDAAPPRGLDALVFLLISRSDVKSVAALKGLNIALDAAQSSVQADIRAALAATGATETRLSVSDVNPIDRLINGEVQAAVLNVVSPGAAEAFPEIKGFKVLRVPLSPR